MRAGGRKRPPARGPFICVACTGQERRPAMRLGAIRARPAPAAPFVAYASPILACRIRATGGHTMLVLSRKLGEKIYIGDNICITVVDIDRGKIRLGIEAPRDVAIYRQELLPLAAQQALAQQAASQKLPAAS